MREWTEHMQSCFERNTTLQMTEGEISCWRGTTEQPPQWICVVSSSLSNYCPEQFDFSRFHSWVHFKRVWSLIWGGERHFKVGGRTFQGLLYLCKLREPEWTYLFLRVNPDFQTNLSIPFPCVLLEQRPLRQPAHPCVLLIWHCRAQRIIFNTSNLFNFLFLFF